MTPLFVVFVTIASTDVLFAVDSIPAVFGCHPRPVPRLRRERVRAARAAGPVLPDPGPARPPGLPVASACPLILAFIGVKLALMFFHERNPSVPHISTNLSLIVIAVVLVVVALASWWKVRRNPDAVAHAGSVREPRHDRQVGGALRRAPTPPTPRTPATRRTPDRGGRLSVPQYGAVESCARRAYSSTVSARASVDSTSTDTGPVQPRSSNVREKRAVEPSLARPRPAVHGLDDGLVGHRGPGVVELHDPDVLDRDRLELLPGAGAAVEVPGVDQHRDPVGTDGPDDGIGLGDAAHR